MPLNVVYKKILKLDAENDCFIFAIIGNKAETSAMWMEILLRK